MWISIDPGNSLPLNRQLYQKLKDMILCGSLQAGEKLPSTRTLATSLHLSRNTVLEAYNQLIAEGYLEGHHGSGTVVTSYITNRLKNDVRNSPTAKKEFMNSDPKLIDFRSGVPDLAYFPRKEWARLYQDICCNLPTSALRYSSPAGVYALRLAISGYLYRTRGISCKPDNIMIVSGSTQGLSLIAELLHEEKSEVIVEDPIHTGLLKVITKFKYQITATKVDDNGLCTNLLAPSDHISFIYTTPSHQYPMGGILPLKRRVEMINYAVSRGCYIIEDDYDSEFRFEGQPINSLYELDPTKVIYIGSFSKILAPAIRLGFLLLPEELTERYRQLKQYSDVHTEAITQHVLARFMEGRGLERHIWRMNKLYYRKREHLIAELKKNFEGEYEIYGQAAGLHVIVHFHHIEFTDDLVNQLKEAKVKIYPVADYSINHRVEHQNEIVMGYAHLSPEEITEGVEIIKNLVKNYYCLK